MLCSEIIVVHSEIHANHKNMRCGKNAELFAHLQNFEKGLLASSRPSACPHGKTLLPLDGFL